MTFFDKLKFWKKEEVQGPNLGLQGMEQGLGGPGLDMGEAHMDLTDQPMYGYPAQPGMPRTGRASSYPQQGFQEQEYEPPVVRTFDHTKAAFQYPTSQQTAEVSPQQYLFDKNVEVISSKLDALRAGIDSLNQRLANVERMVQEQKRRGGGW